MERIDNCQKLFLKIRGMTCNNCETILENSLKNLRGIISVKVNYGDSSVSLTFDPQKISLDEITKNIMGLGYSIEQDNKLMDNTKQQFIGTVFIFLAIYLMIKNTIGFNFIPEVNQSMGYGILFLVGLLTSIHCIAMCGGINLSQCITYKGSNKLTSFVPSVQYNLGRVISYTIIGGIVGSLGSVISFSGVMKGVVAIGSGAFMIIMGINMLGIFGFLRKINLTMPKRIIEKLNRNKKGPFYIGLLNGLMPCGPLQAMQIYALGTGSFLAGALSMFFFSLGTIPLMFSLGALGSFLSSKYTKQMLKVSAILVIVLGFVMVNRGLALSGVNTTVASSNTANIAQIKDGVQYVTTSLQGGRYQPIIIQKGIPVKWTINVKQSDLNGCNNPMIIPNYNLEKELVPGDNVIEFVPQAEGNIPYNCWMGMIRSNIKVVSDINEVDMGKIKNDLNFQPSKGGAGCCIQ